MSVRARPRILCVDDEPAVLEGLALTLRRAFEVLPAGGGAEGLDILKKERAIAVVMSDMRMPGMDGAAFLAQARQAAPDTVRLLLTGQADMASAISAVNEGQIFRFLSKPCPPAVLNAAIDAAVEQHRLITAERVLLEETLHGSIKTLTDVLSLANPVCFGRATRLKQLVSELAVQLGMVERWPVEVAAMLSQLGAIALPADTVEKLYFGRDLSPAESEMVARCPALTKQLLGNIPRLEAVLEILDRSAKPYHRVDAKTDAPRALAERGGQLLKVATDFDVLVAQGHSPSRAVDTLRGRENTYDPEVIEALAKLRASTAVREDIRELPLSSVRVGMRMAEDVKMTNGTLLVARGYEATASFVERVRNFQPGVVKEPVRVVAGPSAPVSGGSR